LEEEQSSPQFSVESNKIMEYLLDLTTLVQILSRQQQRSGELRAARVHIPGLNELCQAHLNVVDGSIQSCVIRTTTGSVLAQGENAVRVLANLILKWNWYVYQTEPLTSQTPRLISQTPRPYAQSSQDDPFLVPYKVERVHLAELNALSRTHRKVFGLIDGIRSTQRISDFLSASERAELSTILNDLQDKGFIYL
jgi:hypothetical protein